MKKFLSLILVVFMVLPCTLVQAAPSKAATQSYVNETFDGEIIIPVKDAEKVERTQVMKNMVTNLQNYQEFLHTQILKQ